jgi:regulator of protease activity HflC (stomatin/prohibitin superfamily)
MSGKPGAVVPRQVLKARLAERMAKRQGARKSLLEGFGKSKAETGAEKEVGVGAGAGEKAKLVSEAKKSKPSEEFVSLSALGKKKPAAQTKDSEEETKPASKKQSDAFEKLKELSEARKKKQTNK